MNNIEEYLVINNKINKKRDSFDWRKENDLKDKIEDYSSFVFMNTLFILTSFFFNGLALYHSLSIWLVPSVFCIGGTFVYALCNLDIIFFVFKIGGKKKLKSFFNEEKLKNINEKNEIDEMVKLRNEIYHNISKDIVLDYINNNENLDKETFFFLNDRLDCILDKTKNEYKKNELMSKIEKIEKIEKKYLVTTN